MFFWSIWLVWFVWLRSTRQILKPDKLARRAFLQLDCPQHIAALL